MDGYITGLKKGTVLRDVRTGLRYRLHEDMNGEWAYLRRIRRDGGWDARSRGWSGSLRSASYEIEGADRSPHDRTER